MRCGVMSVMVAIACLPRGVHAEVDGRITIARAVGDGLRSSADAKFARDDLWGPEIDRDGPCTVHARAPHGHLSAGTIAITGTTEPITLEEEHALDGSVSYRHAKPVADPAFVNGATITVHAAGGADVPAFSADVTAPTKLTGYTPPTSLSRDGYTVTWTAGNGDEIMIVIGAVNKPMMHGVVVLCRVPDTGTFTVPASTFGLIPPVDNRAIVMVNRVTKTIQRLADARVEIDVIDGVGSGPFVLVAPGRSATPTPPTPCQCETSPRRFLDVGFGFGGFSRVGSAPPYGTWSFTAQLGQRLAHGLHIVEDVEIPGSGSISPVTDETHASMGVGIRWTPFEPRPQLAPAFSPLPGPYIDARSFYLTTVLGVDLRERTMQAAPSDVTTVSPTAVVGIGLLEIQGHDWSLGPEFREQLSRFDGHFQRGWQLLIAIYLDEW